MITNPFHLIDTVRSKREHAASLGLTFRERVATELALRCLETATSRWTDDIERELEDELATGDWFHPHLTALARRIIQEAEETA
jgi:hypothetical protein